jgi:kinetochore protein Nuf2
MNATRDSINPAMGAAAEDICGEFADVIPIDTRNLMGFFVSLRQLLVECGVQDFSFADLVRPTHDRLVKIFSYLINFVRFRELQTSTIDDNLNKAEATKARIENIYMDNKSMEDRLDDMKRNRKSMEIAVREKVKRNDELKARLLELRKGQERVAEQLERAKADKSRSQSILEEKTERLVRSRQESEKLRPYVLQSPAALQGALTELSDNLVRDKSQIDMLERRSRALQTSGDSFTVVYNDVQSCVKVLEEVSIELAKEDEEEVNAAKHRDELAERSNNAREVEQNEKNLQRELKRWEERTETQRQKHKEREDAAKAKIAELRLVQKKLNEERADKNRDMERKRIRIEQTEKKVQFLQILAAACANHWTDGRSEREHRKRGPHCARGIPQAGIAHPVVHSRNGAEHMSMLWL